MKKGFTLIEVLAVLVILALLALVAVPGAMRISGDMKKELVKELWDPYTFPREGIWILNMSSEGSI